MFKYQKQFEECLGRALRPNSKGQVYTFCPFHDDRRQSLSINVAKGLWKCHAGDGQGSIATFKNRMRRRVMRYL